MSGKILYTIPLKMVDPLHRRLLIAMPVPATAKNGGIDVGSYSWAKKDEAVARGEAALKKYRRQMGNGLPDI
ncbi:MAG: hypothetical protein ACAI35_10955 [Candidatus Methylacidiphilales bacterium]